MSIREFFRDKIRVKLAATGAMSPVTTPTSRAVQRLKTFFEADLSRHQVYIYLDRLDDKLQSALSTAAMIVDRCLKGFTIELGKEEEPLEKELRKELALLDKTLRPYIFDIARKLLRDGDAPYIVDVVKGMGIRSLVWLPIDQLTILEDKDQLHRFAEDVQERNWYCLNEVPSRYQQKTQWFKAKDIVHFDWEKQEKIRDMYNRWTLGIYNYPPLEALVPKIVWKFSILVNDMLLREVNVPREQHILPSEPYDPSLFQGKTYVEKKTAADAAAEADLLAYTTKLKGRRVDRAYVTLDNVKISTVEPKLQYTAPNELLQQIEGDVLGSVGAPESAVSGRSKATYAGEIAIESYLLLKSEFAAQKVARRFIELAKRHLDVKTNKKFETLYDRIGYDVQLIFFPREMARTIAILRETGVFTKTELRQLFGKAPLTDEQKEDMAEPLGYRFTESGRETGASEGRREYPEDQDTPHSEGERQIT